MGLINGSVRGSGFDFEVLRGRWNGLKLLLIFERPEKNQKDPVDGEKVSANI